MSEKEERARGELEVFIRELNGKMGVAQLLVLFSESIDCDGEIFDVWDVCWDV